MQRRTSIQTTSLIIMLSIIAIVIQFTTYHFFEAFYVIWGVACLASVLCCHLLLEQTTTYEACFHFTFLTLFISLVIVALSYFGKAESFLPYSGVMLGIAVINWLIPLLHCFIRQMLDYGTRIEGFYEFYRNTSIVFIIFYMVALLYGAYVKDSFLFAYPISSEEPNLLPIGAIVVLIEDYIYDYISLGEIAAYLLTRILAFVPYGFYLTLLLRNQSRLTKFIAFLFLPLLLEVTQYIFLPGRSDVDDLIYALIGSVLGSLLFCLNNFLFRAFSGKEFLSRDNDHRYYGSSLHF